MPASDIVIRGAREHNLRDVSLTLPRNQLIVMTGVSGSGKSSLAFDTLYAEGQRRYIESLSSYARQFLGQMAKPDVDSITGLAPSISIQQKASGRNPRSTVGTITEIYDYLRVLFARVGTPTCYQCGRPITAQTREHILDSVLRLPPETKYQVMAPLIQRQKGEFKDLFEDLLKRGFLRARVDGKQVQLTDELKLDKQMKHTIDVVVDRLIAGKTPRARVAEAVETALQLANRRLIINVIPEADDRLPTEGQPPSSPPRTPKGRRRSTDPDDRTDDELPVTQTHDDRLYSCDYACTHCGISYEQPSPQLFSFNSPQGMCPDCNGLGIRYDFAIDQLVPDDSLSIQKGAIAVLGKLSAVGKWRRHILKGVAQAIEVVFELEEDSFLKTRWRELPDPALKAFLYGLGSRNITFAYRTGRSVWKRGGTYSGFIPELLDEHRKTRNPMRRVQLEKYMHETGCATCGGSRLNKQAGSYRITSTSAQRAIAERLHSGVAARSGSSKRSNSNGQEPGPLTLSLPEVCSLSTLAAWEFFGQLELSETGQFIAAEALKEIRGRLGFLLRCGLDYLTLDRTAPTLSGGESQRIKLAGQIGCGLVGVVYILDEPSIGLHPRDNAMLLDSLKDLRDQGNTVIVVEHDDETMKAADYIVDFGPGPGIRGGEVVARGSVETIKQCDRSVTGAFLSHRRTIGIPARRREGNGHAIEIRGATHHNLRDVSSQFPLGKFICVTGVSGSGKSSLVNDILWEVLNRDVNRGIGHPGAHQSILGLDHVDKAIDIDQSPIGRTPRSNPATYVKLFDLIRDLYTQLPESKLRGFKPGRFSFNVPGGRCEACEGNGANKLEMDFLADIWVTCPVCQGKRFNKETLEVRFKGKNINDVLEMDIQQAIDHFANHPKLVRSLQTLHDVGMDYIKLGQPSPTLSGGEAQRIKLAKELSKRSTGKTVYILDEPTTGLHFVDIEHLLRVLHGFVDAGNTVIVVEHNLDVVKTADWIIDLGPEGGSGGGRILAAGTPEQIAECTESYTGQALRRVLFPDKRVEVKRKTKSASANRRSPSQTLSSASVPGTAPPRWQTSLALKESAQGAETSIVVRGASQHNLQHLDLEIPRDLISVFCGPSGSGKSSLAMDTLYAEGQRRYVESLSSYARQFLGQMPKPRVEHVHGLQPSIAIEQKTVGNTPRSTVGTVTEIYDYLRVLFARLGTQHCPDCGIPVESQTIDDVIDRLMKTSIAPARDGSDKKFKQKHQPLVDVAKGDSPPRLLILAPQEVTVGQQYARLWERLKEQGYRRVRIDSVTYLLDQVPEIDRKRKHNVEIVVDRVTVNENGRARLAESIELAFDLGKGIIRVATVDDEREEKKWKVEPFSLFRACEKCGRSFEELVPHNFSFNSPLGWCEMCEGIGIQQGTNLGALISDETRSLSEGAVSAWPDPAKSPLFRRMLAAMAAEFGIPLDVPFSQLDSAHQRYVLYGTGEIWIPLSSASSSAENSTSLKQSAAGTRARKQKSSSTSDTAASNSTAGFKFQYKGLYPAIEQAASLSYSYRMKLFGLVGDVPCSQCRGSRLRDDASAVKLAGKTIKQLCDLPLRDAVTFLTELSLTASQQKIAGDLLTEATSRLKFLVDVGLHYLTLARTLPTLSGGETQRIRLAGQIGRALTGVLYVLDEPTIGLHPSDNARLLSALTQLRDLGNTVVMVEHDREVLRAADRLYDFGPGAGRFGGTVTAQGSPREVQKNDASLTGKYLSGKERILIPASRRMVSQNGAANGEIVSAESSIEPPQNRQSRPKRNAKGPSADLSTSARVTNTTAVSAEVEKTVTAPGGWLELLGARHHNLRNVDLRIPLGTLTAVTGVSGSGKSSLIDDTLARAIAHQLHRASTSPGPYEELNGLEYLSKLIVVDQQPLGSTPASNPATYTGVFEHIRELYSRLPESKIRGFSATRFSFNRAGGRCEACEGNGQKLIEMHFLPDIWVECDACRGKRYNAETLAVTYRGQSIADVLAMPIGQALKLFDNIPKIRGPLSVLAAIGLDYLTLGQPAPTLSGGEAQRVKLAAELARPQTGKTLYLLDEPTTGLHFDDIRKLLKILNSLVDAGNTVVVIEHNLDVIKTADWVIDLGPQAGAEGGWIVAEGTPEDLASHATKNGRQSQSSMPHRSLTGEILADVLRDGERGIRESFDSESALQKKAGDLDPTKIGADARMPWEIDGRNWHTVSGLANNGRRRQWSGTMLADVIDQLEADERFSPVNWNERSTVEVTAKNKGIGWFLHAYTGDEWLLSLKFRVPKKEFNEQTLLEELELKDVNDLDDLPVYNRQPRVRIRPSANGPFEDVTITLIKPEEMQTPAFEQFFSRARTSFLNRINPEALDLADLTPWKKLGRKWHLMRKGFLQGEIEWEPAVLEALINMLDERLPAARVDWTQKIVVHYSIDKQPVASLVTKRPAAIDLVIYVSKGSIQLGQVAQLGLVSEIVPSKDGRDAVQIKFNAIAQVQSADLGQFLDEQWLCR